MHRSNSKQSDKPELQPKLDTNGTWFAAVALLVVLAASIIIYRAGNDNIHTAPRDTIPAPTFSLR